MAEKVVEIAVPLLLPGQKDCEACIDRLQTRLQAHKGIIHTHLHTDHEPVDLCIHYDPNLVSLAAVKRIAETAGAELRNGYEHAEIPFVGLNSADAGITLAHEVESMEGMLHAN